MSEKITSIIEWIPAVLAVPHTFREVLVFLPDDTFSIGTYVRSDLNGDAWIVESKENGWVRYKSAIVAYWAEFPEPPHENTQLRSLYVSEIHAAIL